MYTPDTAIADRLECTFREIDIIVRHTFWRTEGGDLGVSLCVAWAQVPAGNAKKGAKLFKAKCAQCHLPASPKRSECDGTREKLVRRH